MANRPSPALSPELRRWTDTLLDPEVWEHSSDYKPPPASTASRQYRTSAPLPDDFDACAVYVCLQPDSRNLDVVGEGWAIHQNNRFDPFAFEGLVTAASLPPSITNDRLRDVLALQQHLDHLESNQDYYSSLPGGDGDCYVEPGLSEARAAYRAAKDALVRDLYGPADDCIHAGVSAKHRTVFVLSAAYFEIRPWWWSYAKLTLPGCVLYADGPMGDPSCFPSDLPDRLRELQRLQRAMDTTPGGWNPKGPVHQAHHDYELALLMELLGTPLRRSARLRRG